MLCWLWTCIKTVAQQQQMAWHLKFSWIVETSYWASNNLDYVSLHSSSRLWDIARLMYLKWLNTRNVTVVADFLHSFWSSSKFLNWLCSIIFLRLWSSLLLLHLLQTHFSLPGRFPWIFDKTTLYQQPALWAKPLYGCRFVNDHCQDSCQVNNYLHKCGFIHLIGPSITHIFIFILYRL